MFASGMQPLSMLAVPMPIMTHFQVGLHTASLSSPTHTTHSHLQHHMSAVRPANRCRGRSFPSIIPSPPPPSVALDFPPAYSSHVSLLSITKYPSSRLHVPTMPSPLPPAIVFSERRTVHRRARPSGASPKCGQCLLSLGHWDVGVDIFILSSSC